MSSEFNLKEFIDTQQESLDKLKELLKQNKPKLISYKEVDELADSLVEAYLGIEVSIYAFYRVSLNSCIFNLLPALREVSYTISVSRGIKPSYRLYRLDSTGEYYDVLGASVTEESPNEYSTPRIYANLAYMAFQDREARLDA